MQPNTNLKPLEQSTKLRNVCYEIRGPVHAHAARLEADGHRILKLNIGNPALFGFEAPDVIMRDMIHALPYSQGYSESKGVLSARRAIVTRYEMVPDFPYFDVDDVILGNGEGEWHGCHAHNPGYDFNDDCIPLGAAFWVRLAERFLA